MQPLSPLMRQAAEAVASNDPERLRALFQSPLEPTHEEQRVSHPRQDPG